MRDSSLASIGVRVVAGTPATGNLLPLLHEILHALRQLRDSGEPLTIDLRAIPFGPGDEERLLETLGEGEIRVVIDALGRTDIRETGYAGVWIVEHRNTEGARIGLQVEVTDVPTLVRTPGDDIRDSVAELAETLAEAGTMPSQEGKT